MNWKLATLKAGAILTPTYTVAIATESMVYTMPMLAAATVFVTTLNFDELFSKKNDETPGMSEESMKTEATVSTDMMVDDIEGDGA